MNKFNISLIVSGILAICLFLAIGRSSHNAGQAKYWHGRYDETFFSQKRTDSITGAYQSSLVVLLDSCGKRSIEKETNSTVTANKITNTSKPRK